MNVELIMKLNEKKSENIHKDALVHLRSPLSLSPKQSREEINLSYRIIEAVVSLNGSNLQR